MLIPKQCQICGKTFSVKPYRKDTARFCSGSCRASWVCSLPHNSQPRPRMIGNKWAVGHRPNAGTFKPGHKTWNAGLKGIHLSPATEFAAGRESPARQPLGAVTIRPDKSGKPRAWVKIADPDTWCLRSVVVWEATNGPVPRGHVIHHHDRDTLNDAIGNLECMTQSQHAIEHRHDLTAARWPARAVLQRQQTSLPFSEEPPPDQ